MSDEFEDLPFDEEEEEEEEEFEEIKSKTPAKTVTPEKSKTPGSKKISVYFQSTIGPNPKQEKLVVATDAPIDDIKYTVSQIFGLPADEFHLSHAGRTCDPEDTLADYGVEHGDTILLIPVSTAG
jgi:hypothetical protein